LVAGPFVFLAAIVGAVVVIGIQERGDAAAIALRMPQAMPYILIVVQLALLALLWVSLRRNRLNWTAIGWRLNSGQAILRETLLGATPTCIFFGLLHWAGGFWYMVLTGFVAGGLFAGLRVWRGSLIAPFAAHLALNLLESLWIVAR
jgi:hypothetical protein